MNDQTSFSGPKLSLKALVGSGGKIWRVTGPVLLVGLAMNILFPAVFSVGGPPHILRAIAWIMLVPGAAIWLWSTALIATKARQGELITTGPYALVKHPIYTSVGLLVIPSSCFLLDTWLGVLVGIVLYAAARIYAPEEEAALSKAFGPAWDEYKHKVKMPWL
jgi:protein-S-isoprenylcysteine O-methyltransferase Ste14